MHKIATHTPFPKFTSNNNTDTIKDLDSICVPVQDIVNNKSNCDGLKVVAVGLDGNVKLGTLYYDTDNGVFKCMDLITKAFIIEEVVKYVDLSKIMNRLR